MSIVTLEFDNTLEKSEIVMPLVSSSVEEAGDDYVNTNMTDKAQTAVFGILVPLIMINNTIIDFDAIHYFSLKSKGRLPELIMTVEDRYEIINNIDKPGNDNEVRVQIIPKFDNAYKKINLNFFISSINVAGNIIRMTCSYKLSKLTSSQFKSFGECDTYDLFKTIAQDTGLGFATNVSACNDARYTYCDNKSYNEILEEEIHFANATEHIMDWWVDLWDNLNLVDIRERYESVDSDDDIKIWTTGQIQHATINDEIIPENVTAVLTNLPSVGASELFVKHYSIVNRPGANVVAGTDKIFSVYEDVKNEHKDTLVQDGDVKNDIFRKFDYVGENYGEYNYMLARHLRSSYIQKMNSESIVITLQTPLLALMRGHKVNFIRYVNNAAIENKMKVLEDAGLIDRNIESNIPLSKYEIENTSNDGQFVVDRTASGQYLITGVEAIYNNRQWDYVLTLTKPASTKANIIKA